MQMTWWRFYPHVVGFLLPWLPGSSAVIQLVCSGISSGEPRRATFFFLTDESHGGQEITQRLRVRDTSGHVREQKVTNVINLDPPFEEGVHTIEEISSRLAQECGSITGNCRKLLDTSGSVKVTCYKTNAVEEVSRGTSFEGPQETHWAALGETDLTVTNWARFLNGGRFIRSIYAVPIDDFLPGWLGISAIGDLGGTALAGCATAQPTTRRLAGRGGPNRNVPPAPVVVMMPCSIDLSRWWWFQVAPAGSGVSCTSSLPANVAHSDYKGSNVQSFCLNVPDGFVCPVGCDAGRVPVGEIRCEDGAWTSGSQRLKCRQLKQVCVAALHPTDVCQSNGQCSSPSNIRGIIPDGFSTCDLFNRFGKKCGAVCTGPGEVAMGQAHCRNGVTTGELGFRGQWFVQGASQPTVGRNSGQIRRMQSSDFCRSGVDSFFPTPQIQSIQKRNAKSLRITAELQWQQDERSPVQRFKFKEDSNLLTCTVDTSLLPRTRNTQLDTADDADSDRRLEGARRLVATETVTVVGDCCTTDGTDLPAPVELLAGAENQHGTSFSSPVSSTCAPLVLANAEKYEIPASCAALEVGTSCEVSCNSQIYITNSLGVYECVNGMGEQPVGQLPDCVLKSSQNHQISSGSSPPAPPSGPPAVPNCNACAAIRSWSDPRFAQCRAWGDPHFIRSWRPNQKRFDYQGSGVVRYASSGQCGGQFELQAFQCQYKSGRNAVMIGLALRVDGETVYIADTSVTSSGAVQVSPSSIENDRTGINLQSSDGCIFLNVNRKQINANPKYFHNIKLSVLNEDVTQEGVCGAENLLNERVDPTSNEMLFTAAQHRQLCDYCVAQGSEEPEGCGATPAVQSNCDFLYPLNGLHNEEECLWTSADPHASHLENMRDNGQNCVARVTGGNQISCDAFCQSKGSLCVIAAAGQLFGSSNCALDDPSAVDAVECSSTVGVRICACRIPENPGAGEPAAQACDRNGDVNFGLPEAMQLCQSTAGLGSAQYPPREEDPSLTPSDSEKEADAMLKDCMTDVCSADSNDRDILAENVQTELPDLPLLACTNEAAPGPGAFPCNCGGVTCQQGDWCHLPENAAAFCGGPPTVTSTSETATVTSVSSTSTISQSTISQTSSATTVSSTSSSRTTVTTATTTATSTSISVTTETVTSTSLTHTVSITSQTTSSSTETSTSSSTKSTTSGTISTTSSSRSSTTSSTWSTSSTISTSSTSVTSSSTSLSSTVTTSSSTITSSSSTVSSTSSSSITVTSTSETSTTTGSTSSSTSTSSSRTSSSSTLSSTSSSSVSSTSSTRSSITTTATSSSQTWTESSSSSTSSSVTGTSSTDTTMTSTMSTITSSSSTSTATSATSTSSTDTTVTTTTSYYPRLLCGPSNPVGGYTDFSWDGGGVTTVSNPEDWIWRVYIKQQSPGSEWLLVPHCWEVTQPNCQIYCLEDGSSYDLRVELQSRKVGPSYGTVHQEVFHDVIHIPPKRAEPPELSVTSSSSSEISISWTPHVEQGNCTFRSWQVELRDPGGSWFQDPPACEALSSFTGRSCVITNLPCDTPYVIQVRQVCEASISTSDWSRPVTGSTTVAIGPECLQPASAPTNLVATSSDDQLALSWQAGAQEDSEFIHWQVELYKATFVGGQADPNLEVRVSNACPGLLDRSITACQVSDRAFGYYSFAVKEQSFTPATGSPLSARSAGAWVHRRHAEPPAVSLSGASVEGLHISWTPAALQDCIFAGFKIEVSVDGANVWQEPEGCRFLGDATSCLATGLMSNTEYVARGSVLCDECAETPSAQRIPCDPGEPTDDTCSVPDGSPSCFKKLDAFRASSSPSAPSSSLRTMARRSAVPTSAGVSVPTESGQRVTFNWIPGQGSAGDASVSSDCDFQSWQLEIHVQSQSDWGVPEGCADLTESSSTSCIAMNLQCDTPYNARLRAVCLPAAASSDWMAFPSFRTSYAGSCLVPATAPQLLRAARSTPSMLEICFTAGAAGDCVFSGFELQMQMEGSSWMDLPVTCGSLAVREGPCCSVMNLLEGTGYFFRARETCSNGAPLASPFVTSEVALYTTSVPEVPPPSYRDPLGVITTLEAPNRLMLFFEADLQLGASDVPIRVCPALVGTAEAPGPCQCVSEADCASRCAERQDLSALLMSARVLLVDLGSAVEPLTSCTYEVTVEEGFLVTQLEPRKASPRVVWNFTHVPPAPTGSLSLHSSTETSLVVHVTYDLPVTVQCGVLTGEGVAHLAPAEDFTGARSFVEIRITGLEPFTQYTVTCTGVVIGNPALNSTVTQAGLSTLVDTDDTLSGITLVVEALCDGDGAFVQPIDAAFFPPFSPENRQYQLSLDAEEMRTTWCSEDSVEAVVRIQLQGTSTSIFARVTNPQAQVLRQELRDATTGQLPEDVSPNAVVQVSIVVDPAQLGATAPAPYVVEVVLGVLDVRVESHSFPALVEDDTTDTESGDSASLVLSVPVGLTASELNFLLGPHQQQATLSSSEAAPQQEGETVPRILLTFDFASLVGMGDGLPLIIQIQPAAGSSTRVVNIYTQISVSFAAPTVITVETTQVNNLVSLTEITFVTITGANLALADEPLQLNAEIFIASIPPTCDDSECRAAELQRLVSDGLGENLCQSTVVLSTTSLSCNVAPSASASLGLCLVLRGGLFSNYYCAATFPEALQPQQVTVTGVNTPEQEASSPEPIIVTVGSDIPPESVTQGFLQVWVSPFDEPAEDFADPGPGYFPLCADAVVLEDRRSIECYRNQDLNISELGTDLNVYVQTGQYQTSSNVLEGAIQLLLPEIIRVTRNHEYEVGELIVTIDGRHFGTAENGNMVVSVQSFGASSPVVEDPRLAEGFGDPSYTVQCETISHTDTQIVSRCTSTQTNSILGAQVEASLYTETAQLEVDESQGRRLQTTLDELALQLSQLPVAFSVGYQLECSVALRLNQSCDEPVAQTREWQSVRLRPCPAGEHRISYAGVGCLQCLPGYYKSGVGPALFCDPCELGFYMGLTGAGACTPCPPHETTQNTSSREIAACDCAENYFRRNSSVDWTLASNHGVCEPCPYGAICEGGSVLPYSAPGFWTPDRLVFWSCFPDFACLQGNADDPNLCQEGRVPHGRRCGRCAAQTYVHLSECRLCGLADRVLAWVGPFLVPLLTVLIFLPLLIRLLRSNDMARTKRSKTLIKQRGKTRNSMLGHLGDDHGEFRMLVVMWTTLQTLWICHEMPLNFTRFTRDWLWALGVTAWDFSILRPQCAYEISFVWKWLLQWLGFFVMIAFTLLCIWIYTCIHRNANRDYYYISPSQGLLGMLSINFMILLLVHLRDDLIFLQCIDCEDGKLCLAEQPAIECRLGDWEWSTMLVISLMDIFIVIVGCAYMIVLGVYKSWRWQHGNLPGLCSNAEIPWYVLFADLWVRGYIGYIKEIREAVPEFQQEYPHLESEEKRKEVWNKAIDLILAQEAEKAEILLHRLVQHLYRHHPRFRVIGEDEGPALQLVKAITSSYTSERSVKAQNEVLGRAEDGVDSSLKVADVHHVELMMNNLLDYARWTLPGCRAVKRVFAYSWAVVLLFQRFAIVIFCMLMPQDQDFAIPLTYLLVKLVSLLAEASLHPYVWTFLNDWEVSLHALIFVFMLFVSSKWSELTCDILVVVVTGCAVVPLILRLIELLICKDAIEDPTDISISIDEAKSVPSYHLEQLDPEDLERAGAPGALDHVRRGVELVNKSSASVPSLSSPPPTSVEMLQSQSEPSVAAQATIPTEHGAGDVPEEVVPDPPEECIPPSVDKEAGSAYLDPKAAGTMTPGRSIVSF